MNIGTRIKRARTRKDMTLLDLSKILGVSEATVQRYESGEIKNLKHATIDKLSEALDVSPSYLMGWEEDPLPIPPIANLIPMSTFKEKKIPLMGTIAAGTPILAEQNIEEYIDVAEYTKADFALRVSGDSMIGAEIYNGDIVFIRRQEHVEDGQIAAVMIQEGGDYRATLKRVRKIEEGLRLNAENPKYDPIYCTAGKCEGVKIIGLATAKMSQVK